MDPTEIPTGSDLFNRGAAVTAVLTALVMLAVNQYGFSYDSAEMHLAMGSVIIPVSLILEINRLKPVFLFFPTWALGFIPLLSGLYRLGEWQYLIIALPVLWICAKVHRWFRDERIHTAIEETHELLEGDPDELRRTVEQNRANHAVVRKPRSR